MKQNKIKNTNKTIFGFDKTDCRPTSSKYRAKDHPKKKTERKYFQYNYNVGDCQTCIFQAKFFKYAIYLQNV